MGVLSLTHATTVTAARLAAQLPSRRAATMTPGHARQ